MAHPIRRSASVQRPTLAPAPGTRAYEVERAIEVSEGNGDADWELWEDSVAQFDSGMLPFDPFGKVGSRDR